MRRSGWLEVLFLVAVCALASWALFRSDPVPPFDLRWSYQNIQLGGGGVVELHVDSRLCGQLVVADESGFSGDPRRIFRGTVDPSRIRRFWTRLNTTQFRSGVDTTGQPRQWDHTNHALFIKTPQWQQEFRSVIAHNQNELDVIESVGELFDGLLPVRESPSEILDRLNSRPGDQPKS